jgi:hypothetical protein
MGNYAACSREFSARNAVGLTSDERLDLLANGALAGDYGNQEAMLCGLISVLTREEIREAAQILAAIQSRGNSQAPEVWKSLWKQWGRLDPEGALEFCAGGRTAGDARNVMAGWLETQSDAALAWARMPGKSSLDAAAAALAIGWDAGGDPRRMEAAILNLPAGDATTAACIEEYFDMAMVSGNGQDAAATYEKLPAALRPAAWSAAARRIGYGDAAAAKEWLSQHATDPGRNYDSLARLFDSLSYRDPAGTAEWAARLPYSPESDRVNPAAYPFMRWRQTDPGAAAAWLEKQPPGAARLFPGPR